MAKRRVWLGGSWDVGQHAFLNSRHCRARFVSAAPLIWPSVSVVCTTARMRDWFLFTVAASIAASHAGRLSVFAGQEARRGSDCDCTHTGGAVLSRIAALWVRCACVGLEPGGPALPSSSSSCGMAWRGEVIRQECLVAAWCSNRRGHTVALSDR